MQALVENKTRRSDPRATGLRQACTALRGPQKRLRTYTVGVKIRNPFCTSTVTAFPAAAHPPLAAQGDQGALRQIQAQARYVFSEKEFAKLTGRPAGGMASQMALQRLAASRYVVRIHKRPGLWLIVPAEQAHYGAPPVDWWLDGFMQTQEPSYYLALLSAARFWGSSHYALQTTQVMVSRARRPLEVGKLRLEFTIKKDLAKTPVVRERTSNSFVRVSTREATLLDLIRHRSAIGGIEAVARIAHDLAPAMTVRGLTEALQALGQVPAAQRLGHVLDELGHERLASAVEKWLHPHRRNIQPLEGPIAPDATAWTMHGRWSIETTSAQDRILKEVKG